MARPLVIVESPAKAKTISRFLGDGFDVRASVGHVADLPSKGLAVDVDNGFKPTYELTDRGKEVVKELRAALKDADELYLATDEDREGEAISWHLLEELKPKVPVKRMVFHEITQSAIDHAVDNPRGIDYGLVDAAETRRILDRLYGYEVSPVLWRKVNAGPVGRPRAEPGDPARRRARAGADRASSPAGYWDLERDVRDRAGVHRRRSSRSTARRSPTGRDFDAERPRQARRRASCSTRRAPAAWPTARAQRRSRSAPSRRSRTARAPKAPFMTSTLQQEGGRKLRLSASQVMRVAQGLYERGYITYMRTDSTTLSETALSRGARRRSPSSSAQQYLSPTAAAATRGRSRTRRRPTRRSVPPATRSARPAELHGELSGHELRLYELIWQRTLASQMADATGQTVTRPPRRDRRRRAEDAEFVGVRHARSRSPATAGLRRGQRRRRRRARRTTSDCCRRSPSGDVVPARRRSSRRATPRTPPARYTEASLVKRLEELGIGRPSTYASIMQTIQDRGYVWKKGQALVPTWTAFAVVNLLEQHFDDLVDYAFTARMEDDLDAIAGATRSRRPWLGRVLLRRRRLPGLKRLVEDNLDEIDAAEINTIPLGLDADGEPSRRASRAATGRT